MTRLETLNLLTEILEAIQHFEDRIDRMEWSNELGYGQSYRSIYEKNTYNIEIYEMCIDRLNERFNKYKNTL